MLTLALDTTTRGGSVAVVRDGQLLALIEGDASRTHGERMPGELQAALEKAGVQARALDLLAVASGPGAFTGLRIGLAAIQGVAMVHGTPVIGVSALDALAYAARRELSVPPTHAVVSVMDAQRGEVFAAAYAPMPAGADDLAPSDPPEVGAPDTILPSLAQPLDGRITFVGDGAVRYAALIEQRGDGRWSAAGSVPLLAASIALLGAARARKGHAGPPHALQPLYVRRPDAELERQRQAAP